MVKSKDIETRIKHYFGDAERVYDILAELDVPEIERERVTRCVLYLSDSDYDSLLSWVKNANIDRRDIYYFAEYDNRGERKWNFNIPFDEQYECQFRNE